MAKSKPEQRMKSKNGKRSKPNGDVKKPKVSPEVLLVQAADFLQASQPESALTHARRALALLHPSGSGLTRNALPALSLLGEIYVELGDQDSARDSFMLATSVDPEGTIPESGGGGAEKYLWLAQLCEEGGQESVNWFKKGAEVLRREIGELESRSSGPDTQISLKEKKTKLANALCGIVEVYMTDLSWEDDAEAVCDALITEALLVAPESPEALQTVASVRISQTRLHDAQAALSRSLALWKDLQPEDPEVPDFPTRISLSRLLMEANMEEEAIEVLERLVTEDDSSVEAWYLGGWCLHLLALKQPTDSEETSRSNGIKSDSALLRASRDWLQNSLKLFHIQDYEDERLREHATEMVETLTQQLGSPESDDIDVEDDDEWIDEDEERDGSDEGDMDER